MEAICRKKVERVRERKKRKKAAGLNEAQKRCGVEIHFGRSKERGRRKSLNNPLIYLAKDEARATPCHPASPVTGAAFLWDWCFFIFQLRRLLGSNDWK